ncbi:hypothetical protein DPMN_171157 [Dreissena polymorpha]|uniref:Uncharacterized protein n=1 Tax=Dreissena polymorpha TaxID=45954 RepID=A0A9D4DYE6_DREPO|nr:hypothetical protein DPMN_171157 [Dreissena polymorpha]
MRRMEKGAPRCDKSGTAEDIIRTNVLTNFHEQTNVLTKFQENCPPPGGHVFQPTGTIFELVKDITGKKLMRIFHEQRTIKQGFTEAIYSHLRKNAPPPGGHVFQPTGAIFQLIQDIIGTNLLTKLHEDQQINVASNIIVTNLLTKFHEAQTINVASRVLTRKNALSPGGHIFQATRNILELVQYIMGSNLLTKFNDDRTINEASRETNAPPPDSHFDEDRTINVASKSVNKAA